MRLEKQADGWDLIPKPAFLWWTSTYDSEGKVDMILGPNLGATNFSFSEGSRSWAAP